MEEQLGEYWRGNLGKMLGNFGNFRKSLEVFGNWGEFSGKEVWGRKFGRKFWGRGQS